jgi:hypothetical protein
MISAAVFPCTARYKVKISLLKGGLNFAVSGQVLYNHDRTQDPAIRSTQR